MISLNPYVYLGGAISVALLVLAFLGMNHQIHKYHSAYDNEVKHSVQLQTTIDNMTATQKQQTVTTTKTVTQVVAVPGPVKTIVKTIHDAPEPADCVTPTLPEDVKNAF